MRKNNGIETSLASSIKVTLAGLMIAVLLIPEFAPAAEKNPATRWH
jgi:hypothetical protein